jgi:hypothetical protein
MSFIYQRKGKVRKESLGKAEKEFNIVSRSNDDPDYD